MPCSAVTRRPSIGPADIRRGEYRFQRIIVRHRRHTSQLSALKSRPGELCADFTNLIEHAKRLSRGIPPFSVMFVCAETVRMGARFLLRIVLCAHRGGHGGVSGTLGDPQAYGDADQHHRAGDPQHPPAEAADYPAADQRCQCDRHRPHHVIDALVRAAGGGGRHGGDHGGGAMGNVPSSPSVHNTTAMANPPHEWATA